MDDTLIQMLRLGTKGYACSQIMTMMALDKQKESNPGLVRAMGGLSDGCGNGKATCGILTGACCIIAYFAGKGTDEEQANEALPLMLEEINDWFDEEFGKLYGGNTCQAIVGEAGPEASRGTCGLILGKAYAKTMEILADHGML